MKKFGSVIFIALLFVVFDPVGVHGSSPSVSECAQNPELEGCAQEEQQEGSGGETVDTSEPLWWSVTKLLFALLFVLALIYGILKFVQKKNKLFQSTRQMENLGGVPLGQNRSVQAVKIGESIYILGVGDSVEMLTEITDEETKRQLIREDDGKSLPAMSFSGSKSGEGKSTIQFQQLFEKQLSEMKRTQENRKHRKGNSDE
ncbi:flagellar biosynthetic protein FliO [Salimicrobium flavidum]|uniref:Flagellar protein FliO/FliZ n=1 Tax=Salimicrobium flavidum TaxID=570947 RepID=A0A1N7IKN5_9BACI|nr:flagellar biosynthetic protein FliO [Salimicrobium flavidum]SIS37610.1 flagellar protein FliO/FliZ [Salimicrobium flavidum]